MDGSRHRIGAILALGFALAFTASCDSHGADTEEATQPTQAAADWMAIGEPIQFDLSQFGPIDFRHVAEEGSNRRCVLGNRSGPLGTIGQAEVDAATFRVCESDWVVAPITPGVGGGTAQGTIAAIGLADPTYTLIEFESTDGANVAVENTDGTWLLDASPDQRFRKVHLDGPKGSVSCNIAPEGDLIGSTFLCVPIQLTAEEPLARSRVLGSSWR